MKRQLPVTFFNRFEVLCDYVNVNEDSRLIGDSIIREQLDEFCSRAPRRRRRHCIPGGTLDDVTAVCDDISQDVSENTLFLLHAGTNDIQRTRSEALLEKYRKMIRKYKEKSNNVIISGILPRINANRLFYNKAFSTNARLDNLCREEGVQFINLWNDFYNRDILFKDDGLHLNEIGSARLGRLFHDAVVAHLAKNASQLSRPGST